MSLGDNLKELREDRGLTQKELADILGLSNDSVSAYESDTRSPSVKTLTEIARYFEVSVDYLLCLSAEPSPASILSAEYTDGVPVSMVIRCLLRLDREQRHTMLSLLRYMQPGAPNHSPDSVKNKGNRAK